MKKLSINYSRSFPDHRVPVDYQFNKELMKGPSNYFRLVKDGFNTSATKHVHVLASIISTFALLVAGFVVFYNHDAKNTDIGKKNFPGYKYVILSRAGTYGAYDNILQKFQNQKGGLRDLPYDL